jgi:arylsulfatase A-like enzyme
MEKAPGICSDAITRIPMLWRWPNHFPPGRVASELVETVDMVNTLCALAALEAMQTADGKDISHLLAGKLGEVRRIAVTEFAWSKSVRRGNYRYVHYPREMFADDYPEGFGELYDLQADPWEMNNLFFDADCAAVVEGMRRELADWLITTTRPTTMLPAVPDDGGRQSVQRYRNAVNADGKFHPDYIRRAPFGNYR